MSQLPTVENCPECRSRKHDAEGVSVFRRLGPVAPQYEQIQPPRKRVDFAEEEDKYHRLRWCPDGLNRSQNIGYNCCAVWRKPRSGILRC
jgi:hypothetical protein